MPCCSKKPGTTPRRPARHGMTLVEVIVGLTLLATIGAGTVVAFGTHQKQIRAARETLAAIEIADRLLGHWLSDSSIPTLGVGTADDVDWVWKTQVVRVESVSGLPIQVVRLDVFRRNAIGVLINRCSVEVVVDPQKQETQ